VPTRLILYAVLVQIFLTIAMYIKLNAAKRKAVLHGEVDEARRALYDDAWPDSARKINNNIRNQFEVPVLFYVLVLALTGLNAVTYTSVAIAWLFALSRIAHAYVHTGSNYVPLRRRIFMFGCGMIVLLALATASALIVQ